MLKMQESEGRGERITIVVAAPVREAIEHEARRQRRSMSNFLNGLIEDALDGRLAGERAA